MHKYRIIFLGRSHFVRACTWMGTCTMCGARHNTMHDWFSCQKQSGNFKCPSVCRPKARADTPTTSNPYWSPNSSATTILRGKGEKQQQAGDQQHQSHNIQNSNICQNKKKPIEHDSERMNRLLNDLEKIAMTLTATQVQRAQHVGNLPNPSIQTSLTSMNNNRRGPTTIKKKGLLFFLKVCQYLTASVITLNKVVLFIWQTTNKSEYRLNTCCVILAKIFILLSVFVQQYMFIWFRIYSVQFEPLEVQSTVLKLVQSLRRIFILLHKE